MPAGGGAAGCDGGVDEAPGAAPFCCCCWVPVRGAEMMATRLSESASRYLRFMAGGLARLALPSSSSVRKGRGFRIFHISALHVNGSDRCKIDNYVGLLTLWWADETQVSCRRGQTICLLRRWRRRGRSKRVPAGWRIVPDHRCPAAQTRSTVSSPPFIPLSFGDLVLAIGFGLEIMWASVRPIERGMRELGMDPQSTVFRAQP